MKQAVKTTTDSLQSPLFAAGMALARTAPIAIGLIGLFAVWQLGCLTMASSPDLSVFADFAPGPALSALADLADSGAAIDAALPSLFRVGGGLIVAFLIGAPIGLAIGLYPLLERSVQVPFQFLRMISPLAWMPVAVLAFPTWDTAIIFLIAAAAIWPIVFATAAGVKRVDPAWIIVGRSHGGRPVDIIRRIILPAVTPDLLTGIRLALGVAWIVLVPAEYLGVTSGLGYAINDARDTLSYDILAALILLIGLIGFSLDFILLWALKRASWVPAS
ncbi:MAG: ABC transporter permease subunit [Rhodospirillales bacterium]